MKRTLLLVCLVGCAHKAAPALQSIALPGAPKNHLAGADAGSFSGSPNQELSIIWFFLLFPLTSSWRLAR